MVVPLVNGVDDRRFASSENSIATLRDSGFNPVLVPQAIEELWAALTRPTDVNVLGMKPAEARKELDAPAKQLPVLIDERAIYERCSNC